MLLEIAKIKRQYGGGGGEEIKVFLEYVPYIYGRH